MTTAAVAFGPEVSGFGSWPWVGDDVRRLLGERGRFETSAFRAWEVPEADVVVVVKHAPPREWAELVARRSALIYAPVDSYSGADEIDADAPFLRRCARILVHCERLRRYFAPYAPATYMDHHVKFAAPPPGGPRDEGGILWVGVRTNLPPLAEWVNAHPPPRPLDVLTNPERPGSVPGPGEFGFRPGIEVRIREWTPALHLAMTASARAALDVKGEDFRSRHKPPAKGIDFVASGLPLAMPAGSSTAEHLAGMGFEVADPLDVGRWFSRDYLEETRRFGMALRELLAPERVAWRWGRVIDEVLDGRRRGRPPAYPEASRPKPTRPSPPIYGLMITRDEPAAFADWCRDQLPLYDAVVCLDGSPDDATARVAGAHAGRLVYLRERDFEIPHRTDHGLRAVVHREIVRRFGAGAWIMCCHADEYCHHDPRKVAALAEAGGHDLVNWLVPHFLPHPSELADLETRRRLPPAERFRHYHWSYRGDGWPWSEDRLYRDGPGVGWDGVTHGSVRPVGIVRPAPFHPILRHYKVLDLDPGLYEPAGTCSHRRGRWEGQPHRTGLPFPVACVEDLFVSTLRGYDRCDRFEGTFPHPWNMGDEYRPDRCGAGSG